MALVEIVKIFEKLKDVRIERHKKYALNEVMFLVLVSLMSGYESWDEMAEYGKAKINWLKKYLPYKNGIASSDTIRRVFSLINYKDFEESFNAWAKDGIKLSENKIISIDGKMLRKSVSKMEHQTKLENGGKRPVYLLHAWCSEVKSCLSQLSIGSKSNETSSIPDLLAMLELENSIVTIDAAGCQTSISEQIISKKGNYVFSLKKDKAKLQESVVAFFLDEKNKEKISVYEKEEKRKGYAERRVYQCMEIEGIANYEKIKADWAGIKTVVKVNYSRTEKFKRQDTELYYISSLSTSSENLAKIIRTHWSIENNLHWTLDVIFHEDESKNRNKNTATNLSTIRKCAINLLGGLDMGKGVSIKRKQQKILLYDDVRSQIFD